MMKVAALAVTLGCALLAAGCGGATRDAAPAARSAARELGPLASGWRTDFSRHTVPLREFRAGGPGKDGIPALTTPRFAAASQTTYLRRNEPVIELVVGDEARAYPLQILVWHEIVDDRVAGVPVAVTFCPLCNTAIVFDRRVGGKTLTFAVSGNLRNSDLVMYDRQTESWWQQFGGEALVGRYAGIQLTQLPARIVSWQAFRRAHPDGRVLTRRTGYARPYGRNPYVGYDDVDSPPLFPVKNPGDHRLPPKARVVFVELGRQAVAVPYSALAKGPVEVTVGGRRLLIRATGEASSALDSDAVSGGLPVPTVEVLEDGKPIPFDEPFWFAVAAFRPKVVLVQR
jgi:hypothetical protein